MTDRASMSGVYSGVVFHRRLRPRVHALRYRLFMLLVDLDEWDTLVGRLRWLGAGRFGLMTLRQQDHGDGSTTPLKAQIERRMRDAGLPTGGPIRLLTLPRILGYGFNPLSVFYCHDAALAKHNVAQCSSQHIVAAIKLFAGQITDVLSVLVVTLIRRQIPVYADVISGRCQLT